ncbi:hypothetical protein L1987_62351 [Smallanthus sonchifolius]|uniref:Uncharacterized protein n=1 Tax=Smallanthus sonchifolius TaxID=185202 RepID=A0ACB9CA74_9ASTR|nr:hypothetical protein L1987_62351 [Smallanthus sonchifolius]
MQLRCFSLHILSLLIIYSLGAIHSVSAICEFSFTQENKLYSYSLASSSEMFPHGVLSEDGYYKVSSNGTVVWFQLCDGMIFNHDPPRCFDCGECGGPSRCGMGCIALMSNNILEGYSVCTTIGRTQSIIANLIDKESPGMGVVVEMWHQGPEMNCSLSVSIICDSKKFQEPKTLEKVGNCNFATQITHPAGCANVLATKDNGLGWFSTLLIILLCLFGGYLITGAAYRFFYLGIRGLDIIPNLEFWASLPHRVRSSFMSLVRRFRGPSQNYRSSYSPVDF